MVVWLFCGFWLVGLVWFWVFLFCFGWLVFGGGVVLLLLLFCCIFGLGLFFSDGKFPNLGGTEEQKHAHSCSAMNSC